MPGGVRAKPVHASAEDLELMDRVADQFPLIRWQELNAERLNEIAATVGLEVATALLWNALRQSPEQGDFISRVDAVDQPPVHQQPLMLIVPGAFHRHHKHSGADGRRLTMIADELGWPSERLDVASLGTTQTNAAVLIKRLLDCSSHRILIASLSKGACDVASAFRHPMADQAFNRVCAWVSLSGILTGTHLVTQLRPQRLRRLGVRLILWTRGQRFAALDELARESGASLNQPVRVSNNIRAFHIVGFPLARHLRHPWATRGYQRLAPYGPNDGGGFLLGDVTRLPGLIYPVWGADHYMNPAWDVVPALRSILLQASMSHATASPVPASRSTT